jgi:hypothetical protein
MLTAKRTIATEKREKSTRMCVERGHRDPSGSWTAGGRAHTILILFAGFSLIQIYREHRTTMAATPDVTRQAATGCVRVWSRRKVGNPCVDAFQRSPRLHRRR